MSVLPIVARELRVAARQRRSFVVRVLAAAAAVAAGAFELWFAQDVRAGAGQGSGLFALLGTLTLGFGLVAGPLWTASTLCEERREGTLGLLFLTDLTAWDVVLGKLMAASVTALFALLAVLPVLAVSLLLGGVSLSQFGRAALVLGNTLWLSLTLGMAMSARCEQERSATALTVFALFLLAAVLPWAHATWGSARPTPESLAVLALSPLGAWWGVTTPVYAPAAPAFWVGLAGAHLLGWLALWSAARGTARAWRDTGDAARDGFWRRWAGHGDPARRREARRRWLERNPLVWLSARQTLKRAGLWGGVAFLLGAWVAARVLTGGTWWTPGLTLTSAWLLQAGLKWLAASEAAFRLAEDRRSGALELLLTSGLREREIVRGLEWGLRRLFWGPALGFLGVEAVLLAASYGLTPGFVLFAAALGGLLLWDLAVLGRVGLWYSLAGRQPQRAALRTVGRVLGVPWLAFAGVLFVVGVWNWSVVAVLWLGVCAVNNLRADRTARAGLAAHLRAAAAGLPLPRRPQELALV